MIGITLTLALFSTPTLAPQENPPGLVLVKGGKTKVGTEVKAIEPLIVANEQLANTLASQTPQVTVDVDDFLLMVTTVTNEQYAEFVRATGAQPPYYWGEEALEAGRVAFFEEQNKAREEAKAQGKPAPERKKFDPADWWEKNWKGAKWEVPEKKLDTPVTYISYTDAQDYSRWAGLRLMTEFEYTRAARGDKDYEFPWGDDWKPANCNSLEYKEHDEAMPVGSFPDGAVNGIYDLVGNVWQWTASPFTQFDGYKALKVSVGRGKQARPIEPLAPFDPSQRVAVGGSYAQTMVGVRIPTRQGTARWQRTEALGFRCAASTIPGKDAANWIIDTELDKTAKLISEHDFFPDGTIVMQRWQSQPGTAQVADYAVITGYERSLFCPVFDIGASSKNELVKNSIENGPVALGVLSLAHPIMEPEIDGGTYLVAWRGAGKLKEEEPKKAAEGAGTNNLQVSGQDPAERPFWEVPGFDAEKDCFLLYSSDGKPIIAMPAGAMSFQRMRGKGAVHYEKFVPPEKPPKKDEPPIIPKDTLRFSLLVGGKRGQGAAIDLAFMVKPGTIDDTWWME